MTVADRTEVNKSVFPIIEKLTIQMGHTQRVISAVTALIRNLKRNKNDKYVFVISKWTYPYFSPTVFE